MSVVNVQETWSNTGGSSSEDSRSSTRKFTVLLNDGTDDDNDVIVATGIPRVGDRHPKDGWKICRKVDPKRVGLMLYEVTAEYEFKRAATTDQDNPLLEPAAWRWGSITSTEPVDHTVDGVPILTPVGEQLDPPVMGTFHDSLLTITRNQLTYDELLYSQYRDALNSDPFLAFAANKAKIIEIEGQQVHQGDWHYWRVVYQIAFRFDGWRVRRLCCGMRYWTGTTFEKDGKTWPKLELATEGGRLTGKPVLLRANGTRLPHVGMIEDDEGNQSVDRAYEAPVWGYFKVNASLPFADLHLV